MGFLKQTYFAVHKYLGWMVGVFCVFHCSSANVAVCKGNVLGIPRDVQGRGMYSMDFWCCKCYIDFSNPMVEKQDREWYIHFRS